MGSAKDSTHPTNSQCLAVSFKRLNVRADQGSPSRTRKTFDPLQGPQDVGIASKIFSVIARSDTKEMTALFVSDGASDTLCEKGKLFVRGLFDRLSGSSLYPGSALADQPLLFV
jgi:hypothetical protein